MASVIDYIKHHNVESLTSGNNIQAGRDIARAHSVVFDEIHPYRVVARVTAPGSGGSQRIEIVANGSTIQWRCSCRGGQGIYCAHLLGAALELRNRV